jgi:hypothetical protein
LSPPLKKSNKLLTGNKSMPTINIKSDKVIRFPYTAKGKADAKKVLKSIVQGKYKNGKGGHGKDSKYKEGKGGHGYGKDSSESMMGDKKYGLEQYVPKDNKGGPGYYRNLREGLGMPPLPANRISPAIPGVDASGRTVTNRGAFVASPSYNRDLVLPPSYNRNRGSRSRRLGA